MTGFALFFIHLVLSLLERIRETWHRLLTQYWGSGLGCWRGDTQGEQLRRLSSSISRVPAHLGLVVVEERLVLPDLARLVVWAAALGVPYVTVYDHNGRCRVVRDSFARTLDEQRTIFEGTAPRDLSISVKGASSSQPLVGCHGDRGKVGMATSVELVGPDDGRQRIVDIARQLARRRTPPGDITTATIDSLLRGDEGFTDPDLIIKFGSVNSLLGFLPWQTRLSEILFVPTHVGISIHQFGSVLKAYCSTEQRYGK